MNRLTLLITAAVGRRPADPLARNAGFSLLEALIATFLMAIIMGALGTITAQWMPAWDRGVAALQRVAVFADCMDRVTADLAAAEVVSAGGDLPVFDGTAQSVVFVRTTLAPNSARGLEVVRIAQSSDDRGPLLVRSTAPFVPTIADGAELVFGDPVAMLRGPYRVSFSYAGADRVWHDDWRRAAQLPRTIRVLVRDAAASQTLAVSTSIPVHAELSARCAISLTRLGLVEQSLGKNAGAGSTLLTDCLGPSPAGTAAAGPL